MQLTLSQINAILNNQELDLVAKYRTAYTKLVEVRKYLIGETKVEPVNPFLPLTQLPKELF